MVNFIAKKSKYLFNQEILENINHITNETENINEGLLLHLKLNCAFDWNTSS